MSNTKKRKAKVLVFRIPLDRMPKQKGGAHHSLTNMPYRKRKHKGQRDEDAS